MSFGEIALRGLYECVPARIFLACVYDGVWLSGFCYDIRTQQGVRISQSIHGTLLSSTQSTSSLLFPGDFTQALRLG